MNELPKKPLFLIFGLILLANFTYALFYQIKPIVDAEAYDEIATNIVEHNTYKGNFTTPIKEDGAITRIGPGYEIFLATNYIVFGRTFWIIWLLQAVLYGFTVLMLGSMSLRLFPELRNHLWAVYTSMIFIGLLIDIVQLNAMLMTESLFLFLLTLSLFIWSKIIKEDPPKRLWSWIALGLVLGILTLTRPTGLLICGIIVLISIYWHRQKIWKQVLLMILAFILIQVPWVVRNYHVYGQFIFHSTADGMNILSGNYPGNHGEFNSDFPLFKEYKEKYGEPVEFNRAAKAWFRDFVIHHPIQAFESVSQKALILFSLAKTSGFWFHYHGKIDQIPTLLLSILQNFLILGSILLFTINAISKKKNISKKELLVLAFLLILIATPIIAVIANRHRLPLAVISLPIFAYMLMELKANYRKMLGKIILVIVILAISTGIDIYLQYDKFKERINRVSINSQHEKLV